MVPWIKAAITNDSSIPNAHTKNFLLVSISFSSPAIFFFAAQGKNGDVTILRRLRSHGEESELLWVFPFFLRIRNDVNG